MSTNQEQVLKEIKQRNLIIASLNPMLLITFCTFSLGFSFFTNGEKFLFLSTAILLFAIQSAITTCAYKNVQKKLTVNVWKAIQSNNHLAPRLSSCFSFLLRMLPATILLYLCRIPLLLASTADQKAVAVSGYVLALCVFFSSFYCVFHDLRIKGVLREQQK